MKRFLLSRPVGNGMRGILLLAMLLMSLGYSGTDVAYAAPPTHDDFDSARQIVGIEYHDSDNTTEATPIEGAPNDDPDNIPCEGATLNAGFATVWYKYTPPETQSLSLNTFGSTYDTFIAVWTGSRGSLDPVDCNDQTFEGNQSELSFVATGGTTYYIEIAQFDDGVPGGFTGGNLVFNAFITNTTVNIGATYETNYYVPETTTLRRNILNLNAGPVEIFNVANNQILASKRVYYSFKGKSTSYSEMMGLPNNQLYHIYWLPWYNNKTMTSALRIANVSASVATVTVRIGGVTMGTPFALDPGESILQSYPGIDRGPVRIISNNVNIVAALHTIYAVNGVNTSFSEIMALPESKLDSVYWMPWYNNKTMTTQLQISNITPATATIRVYIGGKLMKGSPFALAPGKSRRLSYAGIDRGNVRIASDVKILASQRLIYRVNGVPVSYSEMMGLPKNQVGTTYWLPMYINNSTLNTQLRIVNVSSSTATIRVYIGGVQMGAPFNLLKGASRRLVYAGVNQGPVKIESNFKIVVSERVIHKHRGVDTSYSEMMALSNGLLDVKYWMPWYNNVNLDSQLRLGMP